MNNHASVSGTYAENCGWIVTPRVILQNDHNNSKIAKIKLLNQRNFTSTYFIFYFFVSPRTHDPFILLFRTPIVFSAVITRRRREHFFFFKRLNNVTVFDVDALTYRRPHILISLSQTQFIQIKRKHGGRNLQRLN